ncbi:hypothetical protein FA15DRAFT_664356 [Coprinopsis marcescibilis]|uniref:Uncharacterized protein n=1 Tax=Coprinopsis marcescibilis TaxID=230819 RepID=A0A5C3LBP4_COPMA|nr:hypothetical protein FA15DRAFT_664356 [Coprinopsis marcescibilis]
MSSLDPETTKIPLQHFLKHLTNNGVPVSKAIAISGQIYKTHSTPADLRSLSNLTLNTLGVKDAGDRKLVLSAFRKAGFTPKKVSLKRVREDSVADPRAPSSSSTPTQSGNAPSIGAVERIITPPRRKRTRVKNEFLPEGPSDEVEGAAVGNLEFNEILDEKVLSSKHVVINRAPVMTAWAAVVAEHLNFKREEALSIASVYTEMNAISRGAAIGKYDKSQDRSMAVSKDGPQPYVELMGRRIPLYRTQHEQWRALSKNSPVPPITAFSYISRSFRQTTSAVMGALKLLAESYSPEDLNKQGYALYCEFRPNSEEWGKRAELSCSTILSLRKKNTATGPESEPDAFSINPRRQS